MNTFVVLGLLLSAIWGANLLHVMQYGPERELYPMSTYPMFSNSRQEFADDYYWSIQAANGTAAVVVNGIDMFSPDRTTEPATARRIHYLMVRSIDRGCPDARTVGPCTGDPQEWELPDGYAAMWTEVARARLGLAEDPHALTFIAARVPVGSGVVGTAMERPMFTYYPGNGTTTVLAGDWA